MNKDFNTYKEGLDLEFLREYCMEHGERRVMERGETLEEGGAARLPSVSWRVPGEPYLCTNRTRHASRRPANQGGAFF